MRVAIFVAVLAAHIMLLWLFPSLRRLVLPPLREEATVTPIFLPPLLEPAMASPLEPAEKSPWRAPLLYRSAPVSANRAVGLDETPSTAGRQEAERVAQVFRPAAAAHVTPKPTLKLEETAERAVPAEPDSEVSSLLGPPPAKADWRAQAEVTAQTNALQIVEAEDTAARRAAALTSHFKPLPGPRLRGPQFGWDYAPTHRITHAEGGGFIVALNDRCAILIFLIPMIGCSIGQLPPPNGDLFKYMHKPVKFGDWDWRLDDP